MWLIKPLRRWLPVNNTWDSSWRIHTGILSPSSQVCNRHFIFLCSFKRMKKVKKSKFSHKYFICYANFWVLILKWEIFFAIYIDYLRDDIKSFVSKIVPQLCIFLLCCMHMLLCIYHNLLLSLGKSLKHWKLALHVIALY